MALVPAIQHAIRRSQLSKADFARMMGVDKRLVSYWLRGERIPSLANLVRMAAVGDMTLSALLCPLDAAIMALAWGSADATA